MPFLHTRDWEKIQKANELKQKRQRVNLLRTDANPNPDYRLPHNLLLGRRVKPSK